MKIFLDIGAFQGQTVSELYGQLKDFRDWKILCFEPHPASFQRLLENISKLENVECFNVAVTGGLQRIRALFPSREHEGEGSTLILGKKTGEVDYDNPIKVKAISIGELISSLEKGRIVLKLNIEGSEYEIMQSILDKGLMNRFSDIFLQLHRHKLSGDEEYYNKLEKDFAGEAEKKGVNLYVNEENFRVLNQDKIIRVAHFAEFAPHKSGLYMTTKDLVTAERKLGINAAFIDVQVKNGKITTRKGLADGNLKIENMQWASKADLLVRHSIIPPELENSGVPVVMAIHGRPESSFLLEHRRVLDIYTHFYKRVKEGTYNAYFTFWKEYMFHNALMIPEDILYYVPAMVDLNEYKPVGQTHKFPGNPSILVMDMWRQDTTPYNILMAAAMFRKKYCPEARINVAGIIPDKKSTKTLMEILGDSMGEVHPKIESTAMCYRGADILITPHVIATRVVRESLACGLPIVGGTGNPYTHFTANPYNTEEYAEAINGLWKNVKNSREHLRKQARETAEREFDPENSSKAAKKVFDDVLNKEKHRWKKQDGLIRKEFKSYDDYIKMQVSKLDGGINFLKNYDIVYHRELRDRLKGLEFLNGHKPYVLCLGARQGTEVRAFRDNNCFAIGIDLNPGKDNKYVIKGDFHKIDFPDESFDIAFTNSIDHVYRIGQFLSEVRRILRPKGLFIMEIVGDSRKGIDKWACLDWEKSDDLINKFELSGLKLRQKNKINNSKEIWFDEQLIFEKWE